MQRAFHAVWDTAEAERCDLRTAALMRGVARVKKAKRRRGIFP